MMDEFGKVKFQSRHEVKEGFLLRETRAGVVLEKIADNGTDVVADFEGARIGVEAFFEMCLREARKYVGDTKTTIHVDLNPWNAAINQV